MSHKSPLKGMTQAIWNSLSPAERDALRDNSGLSPQLIGLEGWRVEVEDEYENRKRRFIVGKSTGWRPCHIELLTRVSPGGTSALPEYKSVRKIEKIR